MILVGNGPSATHKKIGDLINSSGEVVRFNNYKTDGFEEFVGYKTTHWWNVVSYKSFQHQNILRDYDEVCLHSWQFNKERCKLWKDLFPICRAKNIFKSQESWIFEMQQFMGDKFYAYSTGAIAIWYYLKTHDELSLVGFDALDESKAHHYGDKEVRGSLHNHQKEASFLKKLAKQDRIVYL